MASSRIFTREATGLVREISPLNALITTVSCTSIGFGIASNLVFIPFVWPGANQPLAFALILPFMLVHSAVVTMLAWSMPRSGGDYVWTSRILHPAIGLSTNLTFVLLLSLFIGSFANYFVSYAVLAVFISIGATSGNPGLVVWAQSIFTNPFWIAVIGTVVMVYITLMQIAGVRFYLRNQQVYWVIGMIGTIVALVLLAGTTSAQYPAAFDRAMGQWITYSKIIESAKSSGFSWAPTLAATLGATAFAWFANAGYINASYFSGEIKSARKSMLLSSMGNNILCTAFFVIFAFVFVNAVGDNFLESLSYLAYSQPSLYTIPVVPNPYFLATVLTNNIVLATVINLGLLAWGIILLAGVMLVCTRMTMAMSFDRVLPTKLADVSDKYHTPVWSIVFIGFVMWLGMMLSLYYGLVFANLNATLMETIVFVIASITAIVFPYVRKSLYKNSPIARLKVGSIPLITILGIVNFLFFAYLTYDVGLNPVVGGPTNPLAMAILLSIFVISGLIYFVARAYHKSKEDIDIALTFKEIPPE